MCTFYTRGVGRAWQFEASATDIAIEFDKLGVKMW